LADTGLGKLASSNPELVQLKRARARHGVISPKCDKDVTVTTESRSIWSLLSSTGRRVTKATPLSALRKAIAIRVEDTKPEQKLKAFGGPDKAPYIIGLEVRNLHEAVKQAAKQALELQGLEDEPEMSAPVPEPKRVEPRTPPAATQQPKVPRPKAPRPQPAAAKAPAPEKDTHTDTLEDALEEWMAEERPTSGEDLGCYLMRGIALMGQAATAAESESLAQRKAGNRKEASRNAAKAKNLKRFKAETEAELANGRPTNV
jgi:hypothetical protein